MTIEAESTENSSKVGAADYCVYLFYVLYIVILFIERTIGLVKGLSDPNYIFYTSQDFVQWYTHILTALGLAVCVITSFTINRYVYKFLFTGRENDRKRTNYGSMAITAGAVLVGGMTHTNFTLLWLQFISYGALLISMLIRTVDSAKLKRPDITRARLAVSYLYIVCLSMAIPVVYSTSVSTSNVFVPLEIITALVLVFVFCYKLAFFYRSGGLVNFGLPSVVFSIAADTTLFVLRFSETANYFLLIFLVLTVLLFILGRILYGNRTLPYFSGYFHKRGYFEGWYVKMTDGKEVLAFIPSYHAEKDGKRFVMLQVVGSDKSFNIVFDTDEFTAREDMFDVNIAGCEFSCESVNIDISRDGHNIKGNVTFGKFDPPKKDIMGFFAGFPFMQCKHCVLSMGHRVRGKIVVDGKEYDFSNGYGYVEKDFGTSFPSEYLWTQGSDGKNSVMLSVAKIPYLGLRFTGFISFVRINGKEYRLATYNGAKLLRNDAECAEIKRGKYTLKIYPLREHAHALAAPEDGKMSRTVYESPAAQIRYVFSVGDNDLLDMTENTCGYERG